MKFDKDNKVIIDSLTKEQAVDFLKFLDLEEQRHWYEKAYAEQMMNVMPHISNVWRSASIRHSQDIEDIGRTRYKVREMIGL